MAQKPYTSYNVYFLLPFAIWVVGGGIALTVSDKETLFKTFNTNHTSFLDSIMLGVTTLGEGWFITVALLVLFGYSSFRNGWYFITAAAATTLPSVFTQILKSHFGAARPLKYFNEAAWIHTLPEWPRLMERSFPSGHSCGAFSLYTLLSMLLLPRYKWLGSILFIFAISTAYSRMYLAAHFFEDVYAGSIIGTCIATMVVIIMNGLSPYFFKRPKTLR